MARKLCEFCNVRTATSQNRGNVSISACASCEEEAAWENTHSDHGHESPNTMDFSQLSELQDCWVCRPELNEALATYVKPERKGHHSPRRPQINHRACSHAQTPLARRACRKAFWAADSSTDKDQVPAEAAPVLTATYEGQVAWTSAKGREMRGTIIRDLGAGRMLVRSTRNNPVSVAFCNLRIA